MKQKWQSSASGSSDKSTSALKDKALLLLARRDHSRRELQQKLRLKGFAVDEIIPVLDELENENLLNIDRFIGSIIRSRRLRHVGPLKICAELQKHGIDRSRIYANEEWQEALWQAMATASKIKRFGEALPQGNLERSRQMRFLQQRGFTSDQIRFAFSARVPED